MIRITPTNHKTTMDGKTVRVWHGVTDGGVPCKVFVHKLACNCNDDLGEFDRELDNAMPPAEVVDFITAVVKDWGA